MKWRQRKMSIPRRQVQDAPLGNGQSTQEKHQANLSTEQKRYKTAIDLVGYLEMPLITVAAIQEQKNPGQISPYALDLFVIEANKPAIGANIVEFANEYPVLGAVLDRFAMGGPIMGLFLTSLTIAGQCLENHGKLPEKVRGVIPGLIDRNDLAQAVQTKMDAQAEQAAAMA